MFGLDYLISPIPWDEFRSTYLDTRGVHISGDSEKYAELFGWDEVNDLINHRTFTYPDIRLAHDGKKLSAAELKDKTRWITEHGATLILNRIQQHDPVLDHFGSILGRDLNSPVNINTYVSWPTHQGFDIHYDLHDVIILQVEGTKIWKVFEPTRKSPLAQEEGRDKGAPPESLPYIEVELSPGDILYIPRGHWHYAIATSPSVHLTIGWNPKSNYDFLHWLLDKDLGEREEFRKDIPLVGMKDLGDAKQDTKFKEHVDDFRQRMLGLFSDPGLGDRIVEYMLMDTRFEPRVNLPLAQGITESITPKTLFTPAVDQKLWIRHDPESNHARVVGRGFRFELVDMSEALLQRLFSMTGAVSGEILMEIDPDIKWNAVCRLLLTCHRKGFLVLAETTDNITA
jgi:ribosomal protein L16 Arg81 hydroxylase